MEKNKVVIKSGEKIYKKMWKKKQNLYVDGLIRITQDKNFFFFIN